MIDEYRYALWLFTVHQLGFAKAHENSEPHQARTIIFSSSSVQQNSSCYATSPIERVIFGSPLCRWNVIGIDFPPNFFHNDQDQRRSDLFQWMMSHDGQKTIDDRITFHSFNHSIILD